ncbi:MAG: hypothetical protein AAF512_23360 [Pseudomonadota bacterium]
MKKLLGLLVFQLFWVSTVSASPPVFEQERELLLGSNETHYFVLRILKHHPGNYYEFDEILFFDTFESASNKRIESILLRKMNRKNVSGDYKVWKNNELEASNSKLGELLVKHQVEYAMPLLEEPQLVSMNSLRIMNGKLCLQQEELFECLNDISRLPTTECSSCVPRVGRIFRTRHLLFVSLYYGTFWQGDTGASELFQAINLSDWHDAWKRLRAKIYKNKADKEKLNQPQEEQ